MLLSVTVETNLKDSFDVGTRLINAEYWHYGIQVEATKAQFYYPLNYRDRRVGLSLLKTTEAVTDIQTAADLAPTTEAILLPVHPENDVNISTIPVYFRTRDITWGKPLPSDPTNKSLVYILAGGFKLKKYVVDYTIAEIVAVVTV